jgi:protoporphyrinogen oxidase
MKVAIVGGGLTGLTSAYWFSQRGHQPVIFEKESQAGGLASGFKEKSWQWSLENFFHHFFVSDQAAKELIQKLGLNEKLFYIRPKTSIFKNGKIFQFDSPLSLLTSPNLSVLEKMRVGLTLGYLKTNPFWQPLEKTPASSWLTKNMGKNAYQVLWQPLLQGKFGELANQIPASWFWARIKKRSTKLGYLQGGFQVLIDKLVEEVDQNGGKILLNHEVKNLEKLNDFSQIIVTVPTKTFLKIAPNLPKDYQGQLGNLKMLGALNLIFVLKERFLIDNAYWLNINETKFPFVAVVEHTNFIDPKYYDGKRILYVGGYYPQNHRYFKAKKGQIFKEWLPYLQKINPRFNPLSVIGYRLSANLFAQPVIPVNYSKIIPQFKTPLPNVYLANMQMICPWDRGVNYAIEFGKKAANEVLKEI